MPKYDKLTVSQQTARSRFRGQQAECQLPFLLTHYVVEKHREALLWSFFFARSDADLDGQLSFEERAWMLEDLRVRIDGDVVGIKPRRSSLADFDQAIPTKYNTTSTRTMWTSQDGFGMFISLLFPKDRQADWPVSPPNPDEEQEDEVLCRVTVDECFGQGFATDDGRNWRVKHVFQRIAFEKVACGDCFMVALARHSGARGLSAFLPPRIDNASTLSPPSNLRVDITAKEFQSLELLPSTFRWNASTIRSYAVAQIHRYAYTIGSTPSVFVPMHQPGSVVSALSAVSAPFKTLYKSPAIVTGTAMLTLNDDMVSDRMSRQVSAVLKKFFALEWPTPMRWEKPPEAR